ncbi:heterokaryon incompatibility protein-domain-containing protein [Podospora appendiculata]|uniref:Heterokaryon incompatibility protein-domain-containing protein n=1 Tax=Podospora appendiculata TaxID=314037 RepID=A0AAE0XLV3_9PEZI|nr:heterokaryon incompatibility protein-domain-containing protein [Podospora appendiculata]
MWLIETSTLSLKFVQAASDVRYAILSHTWGVEEITFQDMADQAHASRKKGWGKVQKTCAVALASHGLKYAWIDTCCIDKTSSSELSEAINSMFAWYRSATVCMVYLPDFRHDPEQDGTEWFSFIFSLAPCRWFKRGWTLQELIAPKDMVFYDESWSIIGSKTQMARDLAYITNVDRAVLDDADNLSRVPIGRRMSWAAHRKTTRAEDLAYSLMGIFDVNMPLLYGEGGEKAFIRLQKELIQSKNDLTLFAWMDEQKQWPDKHWAHGMLATSPAQFRHCTTLKVPPGNLNTLQDLEFTLTNRGLRFDTNLYIPSEDLPVMEVNLTRKIPSPSDPSSSGSGKFEFDPADSTVSLGLNCLETSARTSDKPKWVGIYLEMVGNNYVRIHADTLDYSVSRSKWRSKQAGKRVVYIAPTVSGLEDRRQPVRGEAHHIYIVYDNSMLSVSSLTIAPAAAPVASLATASATEPGFPDPDPPGHFDLFAETGSELTLAHTLRRNPGRTLSLYFFDVALDHSSQPIRLVLVTGFSVLDTLVYWHALYAEDQLRGVADHPVSSPLVFQNTTNGLAVTRATDGYPGPPLTALAEKELADVEDRFHDYLWENASDEAGVIRPELVPTVVDVPGCTKDVLHRISASSVPACGARAVDGSATSERFPIECVKLTYEVVKTHADPDTDYEETVLANYNRLYGASPIS